MTSGPIEKRLRERAEDSDAVTARAAELLQAIPEPAPVSEWGRRRMLRALGASGRNGRGLHLSALQWAVLSVLLVSTAAASAKRIWFPTWFHRNAAMVERTGDAVRIDPSPAIQVPSKPAPLTFEEPPMPKAVGRARASKTAIEEPKAESVRPRLLSDPQSDAIPRVLPKLVYDAETYSVLLDVCVSSEGDVTKASVVRGQEPSLDRDIIEAVRHWKYLPGQSDGKPVAMCFPLVYRIQVQHD
jgi:TonB family protein